MTMRHKAILARFFLLVPYCTFLQNSHAGTPMSDRMAVEAGVKGGTKRPGAPLLPEVSPAEPVWTAGRWTALRATLWNTGSIWNVRTAAFRNRSRRSRKIPACASSCVISLRMTTASR